MTVNEVTVTPVGQRTEGAGMVVQIRAMIVAEHQLEHDMASGPYRQVDSAVLAVELVGLVFSLHEQSPDIGNAVRFALTDPPSMVLE